MKSSRAQAAIEFLITNGWAILVVVILLAVLFYIGVLSPQNTTPNTCLFQPGFSCYTFKVGNGTGSLELDFGQATGRSIQIIGISCSQNSTAALHTAPLTEDITVPSGEHRWITGGTSPNTGIACEGATGEAGTRYKGTACVTYTESGTNTQRLVCGDINARLEPASTLQPTGSPTTTPFPTPPPDATPIIDCSSAPYTISSPGYYYLNSDLNASGNDCIDITSNNVTLDCYGHTINTTGQWNGNGIYLQSVTNVTVRHCDVANFGQGIFVESSNSNNITDNHFDSNFIGLLLISSTGSIFTGNTANDPVGEGFQLISSTGNTFTRNTAQGSFDNDFYCDTSDDNTDGGGNSCASKYSCPWLTSCPAQCSGTTINSCCEITTPGAYTLGHDISPPGACISFSPSANGSTLNCNHHNITGHTFASSAVYGNGVSDITVENCNTVNFNFAIYFMNSPGITVSGNTMSGASNDGIYLTWDPNSQVTGNHVLSGGGIYVDNSDNSNVDGNTLTGSGTGGGLAVSQSNGCNVTNNDVTDAYYGIVVNGNNEIISGNNASSNQDSGLVIAGSGNNLSNNIACWNARYNIQCSSGQTDDSGNVCVPYPGTQCSGSIACNDGCPPPTPPACAPGWVVSSIPCCIGVEGEYTLNNDLNNYSDGGIRFYSEASGSTLDCNHHNITGHMNGIGIWLIDASGITVENCNVNAFGQGFIVGGSSNAFTGNNVTSNRWYGIQIGPGSAGNNFTDNTATGNPTDFRCESGSSNNDLGNTCNSKNCWWLTTCPTP